MARLDSVILQKTSIWHPRTQLPILLWSSARQLRGNSRPPGAATASRFPHPLQLPQEAQLLTAEDKEITSSQFDVIINTNGYRRTALFPYLLLFTNNSFGTNHMEIGVKGYYGLKSGAILIGDHTFSIQAPIQEQSDIAQFE